MPTLPSLGLATLTFGIDLSKPKSFINQSINLRLIKVVRRSLNIKTLTMYIEYKNSSEKIESYKVLRSVTHFVQHALRRLGNVLYYGRPSLSCIASE